MLLSCAFSYYKALLWLGKLDNHLKNMIKIRASISMRGKMTPRKLHARRKDPCSHARKYLLFGVRTTTVNKEFSPRSTGSFLTYVSLEVNCFAGKVFECWS